MSDINFALPSLGTAGMSTTDQSNLLVNQATAIIIGEYLGHMNVALQTGIFTGASSQGTPFITQSELVSLIDSVQSALKSI